MGNGENRIKNLCFVAGFGALAIFLCALYLVILRGVIQDETRNYLSEISEKTVQIVKREIDDNFSDLELAAKAAEHLFGNIDSEQRIAKFMEEVKEAYGFSRVGIVMQDGGGWISGGPYIDLSAKEYVIRALDGERVVSDLTTSVIDGEEILIYAVPVSNQAGRINAAFVCSRSVESMHDKLKVSTFYNEGHSHMFRKDGTFIIETEQDVVKQKTIDRFLLNECTGVGEDQILDLMNNLQSGTGGMIFYNKDGSSYIGAYAPLGINDWFLLDVVPQKTINGEFNRVMMIGAGIVISFIFICLLLVNYVWRLQQCHMERLKALAFEDSVTGGGNITYFRETAGAMIRKAPPGTYAMVALDVNSFKLINVTFGQEAGDRTLKHIYQTLKAGLGPGEILARMGQDRFRLLLKNAPLEQLVKRLEEDVERIGRYNGNLERKYFLSFSAGIRVVDEPSDNIIIIGDQANMARKKAKYNPDLGGGLLSWAVYEPQDKTNLMKSKEILDAVDRAIENHEFKVYLQPKIDLHTKSLAGAEALARWILPDNTMIRPDEFIPTLEHNGQISKLDLYMFREVCSLLKSWAGRGLRPIPVSVNFSRVNMVQDGILEQYQKIQQEEGVSPDLLEIELTETMIQGDTEYWRQLLDEIHRLGYLCSLDDFGSGYSSLNTLKDLSVDILKLDRQFFLERDENGEKEKKIVYGIIQIAKSLGIRTVAEGIEEEEQVRVLTEMGCDMVQGFYYSKPIPVAEFEEKYRKEFDRK